MSLMELLDIVQVQNLEQNLPGTTNMSLSTRNWDVDGVKYFGWHKKVFNTIYISMVLTSIHELQRSFTAYNVYLYDRAIVCQ